MKDTATESKGPIIVNGICHWTDPVSVILLLERNGKMETDDDSVDWALSNVYSATH